MRTTAPVAVHRAPPSTRRARGERGAATVLVVGAVASLVVVLAGALAVAGVVRDVHRARAAADLSALAAAVPLTSGGSADCATAAQVATANDAVLASCAVDARGAVVVSAAVPLRAAVRRLGWEHAVASARAGVGAGT